MNPRSRRNGTTPLFGPLDHVGIAVHDLDAAIALFTTSFGLRLVHVEDNPDQGVREAMLATADDATESAPDGNPDHARPGGTMVQLVAPLHEDSPVQKFLERRKPGLHHLAFTVEDLEDAATSLRASGVALLYDDKGRPGTGGSRVNFVHPREAGGVLVELVEPPATST
ncbi:MAG TPA: methylmalonyl-CoA epimerase [Actinopolymorphaceae bacterium]